MQARCTLVLHEFEAFEGSFQLICQIFVRYALIGLQKLSVLRVDILKHH